MLLFALEATFLAGASFKLQITQLSDSVTICSSCPNKKQKTRAFSFFKKKVLQGKPEGECVSPGFSYEKDNQIPLVSKKTGKASK